MAFFENLGKKLTDAGQGISQQTKNMADVAKLNSAINDKKKQITAAFTALGEAYYNAHKGDVDGEFGQQVFSIGRLYDEIAAAEDEIKTIKGVTKCERCGADIPLNAGFCSSCGAPAPRQASQPAPAPEAQPRLCPNCQRPVPAGNKFCTSCGTKIDG